MPTNEVVFYFCHVKTGEAHASKLVSYLYLFCAEGKNTFKEIYIHKRARIIFFFAALLQARAELHSGS